MLIPFLNRVLPETGRWCVVHIADGEKPQTTFIPAGEVDKVRQQIERGNNRKMNTYYGVCSFVAPPHAELKRNRECAVLGSFRALRVDIDCGDGKDYQTFDDAIDAVDNMVDNQGLPEPLLVSSGRGLHVYWPFTTSISYPEWRELAEGLWACAQASGLHFDDNIREAERLLRLPTSINQRNGASVMVIQTGVDSDVADLRQLLSRFVVQQDAPAYLRTARVDNELEGGLELQPYSAKLAIDTCPALKSIAATGGPDVSEPLWKRILDLIVGGADSLEAKWDLAQDVSDGYVGYSESELKAKLNQSAKQGYPPPTCANIARPECSACPFSSRVKSPATLGVSGLVTVAVIPPQPQQTTQLVVAPVAPAGPAPGPQPQKPLSRDDVDLSSIEKLVVGEKFTLKNGYLYVRKKVGDEFVQSRLLGGFRFMSAYRERNPKARVNGMVLEVACLDPTSSFTQEPIKINLSATELVRKDAFLMNMAESSMVPLKHEIDHFQEFLMSFISLLQSNGIQRMKYEAIGWDDEGVNFVFGDNVLRSDGSTLNHDIIVGPKYNDTEAVYGTRGTLAAQLGALNAMLVTDAAHLILALSVATPLVRFTAFHGAVVSMYSKASGVGKTALLKAVTSIWGNPDHSLIPASSTPASIQHLIGVARSVPAAIDEVSMFEDKTVVDLLYDISQGQGKRRMHNGGASVQKQQTAWQTLLFVTTNRTLSDRARSVAEDSDAILARLLEINMPALPTNLQGGNPDVVLSQNYGHLGRLIAYAIMQRGEEDWKRLVEARVQQWGARLQVPPTTGPDRFRVALCAIADIGVALSRSLGFALDADAVGRAVKQVCDTMVTESAVLTISNETILYRFIADNISRFGRVMYSPAGRSVVPEASREVNCGEIRITMAADNRVRVSEFYIVLHKLMEYVKRNKLNETDFRKWVIKSDRTEFIGDFVFMAGTQHTYRSEGLKVDIMALGESSLTPVATGPVDKAAKKK
jgi:hypothetical protein